MRYLWLEPLILILFSVWESAHGVGAKVLNCDILVKVFEL